MSSENRILFLTGGAGYIGKCLAIRLQQEGFVPILLDNFSTSAPLTGTKLKWKEVDLTDAAQLKRVWASLPPPTGVVHLAARALVGESVKDPALYFRNNVISALNVSELAAETKGCVLVNSSSCAVYGVPPKLPIHETSPKNPVSPYGVSKLMVEQMLDQFREWRKLPVVHLRYFNPAGAIEHDGSWFGEAHDPETHLIPLVLRNAAHSGKIPVFGTDYATPDGTCVRDFIHIQDLCDAHVAALKYLWKNPSTTESFNLGLGKGTSVKEVIATAARVLGQRLEIEALDRRPGDPPALFADTGLANRVLQWNPKLGLEDMIRSHVRSQAT